MAGPALVTSFQKVRLTIQGPKGRITDNYTLSQANISRANAIQVMMGLVQTRGMLLAANCAVVDAVLSLETTAPNYRDGFRLAPSQLWGAQLLKEIDNTTPETTIEAYANPEQGFRCTFDSGNGIVDHRLIRMVRGSWIFDDAVAITMPTPGAAAAYPFAPVMPDTPTHAVGVYLNYVRKNTSIYQAAPGGWNEFTLPETSPWSIDYVGKKTIGLSFPNVRGRKAVFA